MKFIMFLSIALIYIPGAFANSECNSMVRDTLYTEINNSSMSPKDKADAIYGLKWALKSAIGNGFSCCTTDLIPTLTSLMRDNNKNKNVVQFTKSVEPLLIQKIEKVQPGLCSAN